MIILYHGIIRNFWYAGSQCTYCNDSWEFIENMLHLSKPPFIFHLLATGWHYAPIYYSLLLVTNNSTFSLLSSVFIVQFVVSLLSILLIHYVFEYSFHLDKNLSIFATILVCSILFPYYILQPASELLFSFYQLLAWYFYTKKRYHLMLISSSMTFALRFNGAFFVLAVLVIYIYQLAKTNNKNNKKFLLLEISTFAVVFLIGFSSFIFSFFAYNNFWYPLTSQLHQYNVYLGSFPIRNFQLPFLWWINYVLYVSSSWTVNSLLFLLMGIISFLIGLVSEFLLMKNYLRERTFDHLNLFVIYTFQFLGLNMLTSLGNFARFLAFSFPFFPIIPLALLNKDKYKAYILLLIFSTISILINIIWLTTYPTAKV